MTSSLPISRLVRVSVTLTQAAAQAQNLSTLLILGTSAIIDVVQRMRRYTGIDEVATEFGTTSEEYLAAVLYFEQAPQPAALLIGRWANTASHGQLIGGTLASADQAIAAWNSITTGSFAISINGGGPVNISGLNFAAPANLNGVASIINTALTGAGVSAQVAYDSNFQRFVFTTTLTGASANVAFLTATGSGTDIHNKLAGTAALAAYRADGIAAETAAAAAALFDNQFSQQWYALQIPSAVDADHLAVAAFIEATTTKHIYGVTTQEAGVLSSVDTSNIAYQLKQLKYKKTVVQYSSTNPYAVASLLGRELTVDYDGNGTVITLMFKQEPGIVAESLNSTQMQALEGFNCNVFVNYNNNTAIVEPGVMASGDFVDTITGADWLAVDIMTSIYNVLYTSPTKIPQTDAGQHILATAIEAVLAQGVVNGFLGPGVWDSAGFGTLKQGDFLNKGYYVFQPPIATQSAANRAARKSVAFQVAAKQAGATHSVDISVVINQ